jgi:hypothetical protein
VSSNDFLLILNDRAASAEAGEQRVGDGIAADVVLCADFLALEELESGEDRVSVLLWGEVGRFRTYIKGPQPQHILDAAKMRH